MNIEILSQHYLERMAGLSGNLRARIAASLDAGAVPVSVYDFAAGICTCSLRGDAVGTLWTVPLESDEATALGDGVAGFLNALQPEVSQAIAAYFQNGGRILVSLEHRYEPIAQILVELNGDVRQLAKLDTTSPVIH